MFFLQLFSTWAGNDALIKYIKLHSDYKKHSFALTKLGGIFARPIAEFVIMSILQVERQVPLLLRQQAEKKWEKSNYSYRTLDKLTIGVLGTCTCPSHTNAVSART